MGQDPLHNSRGLEFLSPFLSSTNPLRFSERTARSWDISFGSATRFLTSYLPRILEVYRGAG
jgi:hypothetical protein